METVETTTEVHTPASLITIFANALKVKEDKKILLVKGIYQKSAMSKKYGKYYYEKLKSELDDYSLTILVSDLIKKDLQHGQVYTIRGFIDKKVKDSGSIDINFNIMEVVGKEEPAVSDEEMKRFEIMQRKAASGYKDFEGAVKKHVYDGTCMQLAVIYGNSGIVDQDFKNALGEASSNFVIHEKRINLSSKSEIIQTLVALSELYPFDAIAIVRGGGSGLEIFNDAEIALECVNLKPIFITAIGHASDNQLINKVSDKSYITPTDFASNLKRVVDEATEEMEGSKARLIDGIKKTMDSQYLDRIKTLAEQLEQKNKEFATMSEDNKSNIRLVRELEQNAAQQKENTLNALVSEKIFDNQTLSTEMAKQNKKIKKMMYAIAGLSVALGAAILFHFVK